LPTLAEEFQSFWACYPRRVSRQDAMKAYQKARVVATAEEILDGLRVYREHMPDELRYVPHAATWLNAGRWQDEYDTPALIEKKPADFDWYTECALQHGGACGGDRMAHHVRMSIEKGKAKAS
jgi:hypothetical protein